MKGRRCALFTVYCSLLVVRGRFGVEGLGMGNEELYGMGMRVGMDWRSWA